MDRDLRELERLSSRSPLDRHRYRLACVRSGRPDLAGFRPGDRVSMDGEEGVGTVRRVLKTRLRIWFDLRGFAPDCGVIPVVRLHRGRTRKVRLLVPFFPATE